MTEQQPFTPRLSMKIERMGSTKTNGFKVSVDDCADVATGKDLLSEAITALGELQTKFNETFPVG